MQFTVTAPNRMDLAGGTTDLYPLYLFMEGGVTVNAAVSVSSRVHVRSVDGPGITLISEDLGRRVNADKASQLPLEGLLGLVGRIVRAVPPNEPVEIVTKNEAPAGSGLGASSALTIALLTALNHLNGASVSKRETIQTSIAVETANLGIPGGQQDCIAALYGGVSILEFGYSGYSRKTVDPPGDPASLLEEIIILTYSGLTRFSGMNNWEFVKNYIEGREDARDKLIRIRDIAAELAEKLPSGDIEAVSKLIDREWQIRRTLAAGVSTDQIAKIMMSAVDEGALASKVCGAGGGGCMITVAPPEKRSRVEKAITDAGGTVMPFTIDREGARVVDGGSS